ncbi:MAG: hypothetical protein HQ567_12555 [Candidatus Nealsonbacteria bacterium]|nr:hypothetical protein [Candidatus Nealsonbacteria bacterium]
MRCSCGQETGLSTRRCERCEKTLLLGMDPQQLLIDAVAAGSLLVTVLIVLLIGRATPDVEPAPVATTGRDQHTQSKANPLGLAVTPHEFDDMGGLLQTLGPAYARYDDLVMDDLLQPKKLSQYNAVFLTCRQMPLEWTIEEKGREAARGGELRPIRPEIDKRLRDSLRSYVYNGGALYASDFYFYILKIAFPEFIDKTKMTTGAGHITVFAEVVDWGLKKRLGRDTIELHFDKEGWIPAAFDESKVTTHLRGTFRRSDGRRTDSPLLVQFDFGKGSVVFTSFHNEKQTSDTELELLRYLVFTTLTAQTEAQVRRELAVGGFSPVDRSLLSASGGQQKIVGAYLSETDQDLKFVLDFEGPRVAGGGGHRAKLRLDVTGPDGRTKKQREGTSTIEIDVPGAAGKWSYTVTLLKVPHENFPFTLHVAEKL